MVSSGHFHRPPNEAPLKTSPENRNKSEVTTWTGQLLYGDSVAAWLSEKVLRGRGPDARSTLRRAMDVCVCLLGADGRVVERRINTFSATTARSVRVRVPSGKGAYGFISVVYVCECEVEWAWVAGENAPEPRRTT
ncbi:hypothetical protein GEV33_009072 [Tenebrio molitor]|uniref:Uncharacterized protein n=1 Tax=Tenebrio molitor TaxID=7067 RepID=A0A8J6HFD7_TENMO|nr:hypothetical protein GEV33_009072 [Tenebrio molitor]